MRYAIFTKTIHVEKIVNFLNETYPELDYIISTSFEETKAFDFDIGISYCFPYKVDVEYPTPNARIWYNYHPAPLPRYAGSENYALAINDKIDSYGVTLHIMTQQIDRGETVAERSFWLESKPVNTNELGSITHYYLFQLFKKTIIFLQHNPRSKEEMMKFMGENYENI